MIERQEESYVWTSRDGRRTPINRMNSRHLINAIKMVMRNNTDGEIEQFCPMIEEAIKRGLIRL